MRCHLPAEAYRWCERQARRTFDAAEGEFVAFRCNRRRHPLVLAAALVVPSLAISLRRE
ncbi:MAG: hypothetical protein ACRDOH_00635 [Streptosporangiaceae bacterium]